MKLFDMGRKDENISVNKQERLLIMISPRIQKYFHCFFYRRIKFNNTINTFTLLDSLCTTLP